jgi:hypothetical protein
VLIPYPRPADGSRVSSFIPAAGDPADRSDPGFFASPAAPGDPVGYRPPAAVPRPPAAPRSPWAKSDVSFGPVGRILITLVMLVVGIWLAIFALIGAGVWWLVIVPWAMRDLWGPVFRRR